MYIGILINLESHFLNIFDIEFTHLPQNASKSSKNIQRSVLTLDSPSIFWKKMREAIINKYIHTRISLFQINCIFIL